MRCCEGRFFRAERQTDLGGKETAARLGLPTLKFLSLESVAAGKCRLLGLPWTRAAVCRLESKKREGQTRRRGSMGGWWVIDARVS